MKMQRDTERTTGAQQMEELNFGQDLISLK